MTTRSIDVAAPASTSSSHAVEPGAWLFLTAPVSFVLTLAIIIYLSQTSF